MDSSPIVEGFLEDYNGIPYRNFYGYRWAYERADINDIWNAFYLLFSMIFYASQLRTLSTFWGWLRGDYKDLGFLRKWAYMYYRIQEPGHVVTANMYYCFQDFMATVLTAMIMWWSYPVFIFYKFFRGRSFDFDFDEIMDEGKKLSQKQGLVYHYWGESRYQTLF